jgi:hypothetical protein
VVFPGSGHVLFKNHSPDKKSHDAKSLVAGRVRGLKGHRWLIAACETKLIMTDLVSQASREIPRALLDGRAPTSLAFLYKSSPLLLGMDPQASCLLYRQAPLLALAATTVRQKTS